MLIKKLEIMNCRKIRQATVEFHGPGVKVIKGANMGGKSTIAQTIALTMNGAKDFTPGMITHGEEKAEIIAYTDDGLKIRTVLTDTAKQTVQKYNEGLRRFVDVSGGVRTFLNSICSGLEMPWTFRDVPDVDVVEMLIHRSGASNEIAAIDTELADKERLRTETGRDRKRLGDPGDSPEKVGHPDPIDDIKAEYQKTREYQKVYAGAQSEAQRAIQKAIGNAYTFEELEHIVPLVKKEVAAGREKLIGFKAYTKEDVRSLDEQIAQWFDLEEKAKIYDAWLEKKTQCEELDKQYNDLTDEIKNIRTHRKKVLADMKLGVKGLEIGEDNMLYHNGVLRGITKSDRKNNWSTAESVQVFFGLGARFAGDLKVLCVDNAESLDKKTTEVITAWAENEGFLVILLRVAEVPENLEDGVIYVKEGEVLTK
jgi:hypothetical protein